MASPDDIGVFAGLLVIRLNWGASFDMIRRIRLEGFAMLLLVGFGLYAGLGLHPPPAADPFRPASRDPGRGLPKRAGSRSYRPRRANAADLLARD